MILFGSSKGIFRLPAEGGTPEPITALESSEIGHFWPNFLPDGRHYLYTVWSTDASQRAIYAGELGAKERTRVLVAESNAVYSHTGHLLFHRGKAVYAQSFDPKALTLSGEPFRVADEVSFDDGDGRGHFAASQSGPLAYFENRAAGGAAGAQSDAAEWHLTWASRTGQVLERPGPVGNYRGVDVSPDTKRIAVHRHEPTGGDIWVVEPSGSETRLTWDATQHNSSPVWSPDGKSIVFWVQDPKTKSDLWLLSLADKKAVPLLNSPFSETHAQISPDGKWIAYTSDSVGKRREIHVQPFPAGAGHWQISDAGGDWPRWRKDGKVLFYHSIGPIANPQTPGT